MQTGGGLLLGLAKTVSRGSRVCCGCLAKIALPHRCNFRLVISRTKHKTVNPTFARRQRQCILHRAHRCLVMGRLIAQRRAQQAVRPLQTTFTFKQLLIGAPGDGCLFGQ